MIKFFYYHNIFFVNTTSIVYFLQRYSVGNIFKFLTFGFFIYYFPKGINRVKPLEYVPTEDINKKYITNL